MFYYLAATVVNLLSVSLEPVMWMVTSIVKEVYTILAKYVSINSIELHRIK